MNFKKLLWLSLLSTLAISLLAFAACKDDKTDGGSSASPTASPEEIAAIEQLITDLAGTDPTDQADVDFFFAHVTDALLEGFLGATRDECMADPRNCIGEPSTIESTENTTISGSQATSEVTADFGNYTFAFVQEGDVWMLDELTAISPDIPAGVTAVSLQLNEFAFGFNRKDIVDGNFAFASENIGKQDHQVGLAKLDEGVVLDDAIHYEGDGDPPGVTTLTGTGPIRPGDELNVVFEEPLEPGRYALFCFFPDTDDPENTPHAFKGMTAELEVPAE